MKPYKGRCSCQGRKGGANQVLVGHGPCCRARATLSQGPGLRLFCKPCADSYLAAAENFMKFMDNLVKNLLQP